MKVEFQMLQGGREKEKKKMGEAEAEVRGGVPFGKCYYKQHLPPDEAHEHRDVVLEGCVPPVHVDVVGPPQELLHLAKTVLQAERQQAHRGGDGVAPAHPVPEPKRIL
jgi:hypothetical protein